MNPILRTDAYKASHWRMDPPGTKYTMSYMEARSDDEFKSTVFFGLQYLIMQYLDSVRITYEDIEDAKKFYKALFGRDDVFNYWGWRHILYHHKGVYPIRIRAVPEGSVVPAQNVLLTIENTDPRLPWLTNHFETILQQLWYPCTVATISRHMKQALAQALRVSSDLGPEALDYMLHDFGYRGSSSQETAAIGGAAHLINFKSTDTLAGIELLNFFYDYDGSRSLPGASVPAAEHASITAWGRINEADAYRHILNEFDEGIVSVVSDSYDLHHAVEYIWGETLHQCVRAGEGKDRCLVIRPDSGDPRETLPWVLDMLGRKFGKTTNSKGCYVLPDYVRVIQGDGVNRESLEDIIDAVLNANWSIENLVFGCGTGLLNSSTRDTTGNAIKRCAIKFDENGRWLGVYKRPSTDPNKSSKPGYLHLDKRTMSTVSTPVPEEHDLLREVLVDGELIVQDDYETIQQRARL